MARATVDAMKAASAEPADRPQAEKRCHAPLYLRPGDSSSMPIQAVFRTERAVSILALPEAWQPPCMRCRRSTTAAPAAASPPPAATANSRQPPGVPAPQTGADNASGAPSGPVPQWIGHVAGRFDWRDAMAPPVFLPRLVPGPVDISALLQCVWPAEQSCAGPRTFAAGHVPVPADGDPDMLAKAITHRLGYIPQPCSYETSPRWSLRTLYKAQSPARVATQLSAAYVFITPSMSPPLPHRTEDQAILSSLSALPHYATQLAFALRLFAAGPLWPYLWLPELGAAFGWSNFKHVLGSVAYVFSGGALHHTWARLGYEPGQHTATRCWSKVRVVHRRSKFLAMLRPGAGLRRQTAARLTTEALAAASESALRSRIQQHPSEVGLGLLPLRQQLAACALDVAMHLGTPLNERVGTPAFASVLEAAGKLAIEARPGSQPHTDHLAWASHRLPSAAQLAYDLSRIAADQAALDARVAGASDDAAVLQELRNIVAAEYTSDSYVAADVHPAFLQPRLACMLNAQDAQLQAALLEHLAANPTWLYASGWLAPSDCRDLQAQIRGVLYTDV